ncbi:MAG: CRTAC1 family protein [Planctomycetaceae bacterium]
MACRIHYRSTLVLGVFVVFGCANSEESAPTSDASASTSEDRALTPSRSSDTSNADELANLLEVGDSGTAESLATSLGFKDVAASSGISFHRFSDAVPDRYFLPEVMGGGVAWFDYDGDGQLDLYATNGSQLWGADPGTTIHRNQLFRNRGHGQFTAETIPSRSGDRRYGQGCAVGDFNADGFPDLYVTNYDRNTLLVSNGDGTFTDGTVAAGVGDQAWGTSAVWFDANSDGLTDLYVVNYLNVTRANHEVCTYGGVSGYCGPGHWDGTADLLCLNQGDGHFQITAASDAVDKEHAKGLAVVVCDFDSDGQPEIYVGNDMAPNILLTRTTESIPGAGTLYRNVAEYAGCAVSSDGRNEASMGVACSDFDNDGKVDIFLTHFYQDKNTLYRNLDSLLFEDNSRRSRAAATSYDTLGFGTVAADFDNDGDDDLFIANGHVLGPRHKPNAMKPQLLENDGHGVFSDSSHQIGGYFSRFYVGRGVAKGDFDNDGRVDIAVSHIDRPMAVLHNETHVPHGFIGLDLLPIDRVHPSGGQVIVTAGKTRQVIPIVGGGSYLSSSDPRIVVGLGEYKGPVNVSVAWPGRNTETFHNLSSGQYWHVREGKPGFPSWVSPLRTDSQK